MRTYLRWLLSAWLASAVAAAVAVPAFAKQDFYGPLTIQIIGAGGDRSFEAVSFADRMSLNAVIQKVGSSVAVGAGVPAGLPAPLLRDYYELVFIPDSTHRLPWYGMTTARFFYYPAGGKVPAYLRLQIGRVSEPINDAWLPVEPYLVDFLESHLDGLAAIHPRPQRSLELTPGFVFGLAAGLMLSGTVLLARVLVRRVSSRTAGKWLDS